jgi:hypothetical protein
VKVLDSLPGKLHIGTIRKNTNGKESTWEKPHIPEQGLMAGWNCQPGWGKMAQC